MESLKAIAGDNSQKENNPFLTNYLKERSLQGEVPLSNAYPNFASDQGEVTKSQQPLKVRNMTTQVQNHRPNDQAQLVDKFRKLRQWQQQQQESMFRQQQQQMETLRMEQNKLQSILAAQRKLQGQTATSTSMYPPNSETVSSQSQSGAERSLVVTSQLHPGSVRLQAPLERGSRVQFEDDSFVPARNSSNTFARSIPTSSKPSYAMDQIALEMQTSQLRSQQFGKSELKFSVNEKDRLQASFPYSNEKVYPVMWNSSNLRFPLGAIPPVAGSRAAPIPEQPTIGSAVPSNSVTYLGMTEIPQHFQGPVISQRPGDMLFQNNPATNSGDYPELNLERIDITQYGRNSAMTPELERLWSHNAGIKGVADADSQEDEHSEADTLSGVYPLHDSESDTGFNEIEDDNGGEAVNVESDVEEELDESFERDKTVIDLHAQSQDSEEMNEQQLKDNCQTEVGDEMPIKPGIGGLSWAKTFEELLEEQLKLDTEASKQAAKAQSTTHKPPRTFLRKGQGLARYKGKSTSAKVITKTQEPVAQLTTVQQKKEKETGNPVAASSQVTNKSGGVSGGSVVQSKVTRKVASRSSQVMTEASGSTTSVKPQQIRGSKPLKTQAASSDGQPAAITVARPAVMPTSDICDGPEERDPPSVFNSIDASFQMRLKELEEKQELEEEELEEFELLEQAAANASFSSNSSVVVKVLAKARGGGAQISQNNAKEGTVNKPENKVTIKALRRSVPGVRSSAGAGGILSPVDTGYGSGDCKVTLSVDGPGQLPVSSQMREFHDNAESVDEDSDVTLKEMSLDSALELDCGQDERTQSVGDQQRVLAPVYLNPPSTESDDEFNDADTWAAVKKQAGTNIEKMEKKVEVDSDDDDDDADDSDVTISDIFPLVTSTPPVPRKVGQPQISEGIEAMDDEVLVASTPPTSALVTKLFPQLKPKQKAAAVSKQATTEASKNPSDKGNTEEQIDTVQSIAVREKLKELEAEIDKFRTENSALAKIRREREEGLQKLQTEIAAFEKQKAEELERLEQFREEEMRKLRRERRVFEKYQKAARSMPDKKEREEIESLREQVAELQEELKRRESRWSAASTRSRQKIETLEEQNKELQEEVKLLEHYRLQQWREDEQAKAKKEEESRLRKPLLRKTAKTTEEELGLRLSGGHRSPPIRPALAEVVPRSTLENAAVDPETRLPVAGIQVDTNDNRAWSSRQDENTPTDVLFKSKEEISSVVKPMEDYNGDKQKSKRSPRRRSKTPDSSEKLKRNVHFQDEEKYDESNAREISEADERTRQDTREIVHPDGKVEKVNSDGSRVISFANGTRKDISVDGQTITVTFFNGDIKQIMPDQRVMYYYSDVQTTHTTYPDGLEVLQFPSKQIEKHYPDGTKEIIFPDQTIKYLYPNGAEECVFSDGTIQKVGVGGERTIEFPNGQRETHTKFYKKREYPDGTVKTVYPDGRTETRYSSGRMRVKDREGRVLVDSSHLDK